jgi:hypothetical protein
MWGRMEDGGRGRGRGREVAYEQSLSVFAHSVVGNLALCGRVGSSLGHGCDTAQHSCGCLVLAPYQRSSPFSPCSSLFPFLPFSRQMCRYSSPEPTTAPRKKSGYVTPYKKKRGGGGVGLWERDERGRRERER